MVVGDTKYAFKNSIYSILGRSSLILVDLLPSVPDVVVASPDKLCKVIFHDYIAHIVPQFIMLRDFSEFYLSPPLYLAETVFDWAYILRRPRHDSNIMILH